MTVGSWACGCCYLLFIYRPVMLYVLLYIPRLKAVCLCCVGVGPEAEQADLQHARPWWLCNWTQPELWGIIPSLKLHGQHRWGVYVNDSIRNDSSRVIMVFLLSLCSLKVSVCLCSAYLGRATICTQGEMCEDFPGQRSQLWKGNKNNSLALFVVKGMCRLLDLTALIPLPTAETTQHEGLYIFEWKKKYIEIQGWVPAWFSSSNAVDFHMAIEGPLMWYP